MATPPKKTIIPVFFAIKNVENTDLRIAFTRGVSQVFVENASTIDPKKYSAAGREEVKKYVMDKIKVCGSEGKA